MALACRDKADICLRNFSKDPRKALSYVLILIIATSRFLHQLLEHRQLLHDLHQEKRP